MSTYSREDAIALARNTGNLALATALATQGNSLPPTFGTLSPPKRTRRPRQTDPLAIPPHGDCAVSSYLPIEAISTLNTRMHPMKLHRVKNIHRAAVRYKLSPLPLPRLPIAVTLTRIYVKRQRKLDAHDNLPAAFKAVVDAIAELYGIRDDDPRVTWDYDQEKRQMPQPCVRVALMPVAAPSAKDTK